MQTFIIILTVFVAILLVIVVLIQKSKGGGLASNFAGSNQIMGVRRTNDFIEKATWTLACIMALLSIIAVLISPSAAPTGSQIEVPVTNETQVPAFPVPGTEQAPQLPVADEMPSAE